MQIVTCTEEDIPVLFQLYDVATAYQKQMGVRHWLGFERSLVETEIRENRQWKILENGQIACVFVVTWQDPLIWKEKDRDPAIYLHRIAINPQFRGGQYVKHIVAWAQQYAKANGKQFVRLDTHSGNEKLNTYYVSCGFTYLGVFPLDNVRELPAHYHQGSFSLFELKIP
ncbi:GNAT family N-acetyltransferase [Larkinella arboricola]